MNIGICIGNHERLGDDYFYTETGIEEVFFVLKGKKLFFSETEAVDEFSE